MKDSLYGFRWSQNILRLFCYGIAFRSLLDLKWFLGIPIFIAFLLLAFSIEENRTNIIRTLLPLKEITLKTPKSRKVKL